MSKRLSGTVIFGIGLFLAACGNADTSSEDETEITVAFGVGTYEEHFRNGILPILEEQGYTVNIRTFSQNNQINPAMQEGSIDASVFQSTAYQDAVNDEIGASMTALTFVPSAPQGLYSDSHTSLDEVTDGTTVAVPNDPVNQERAVRILENLGWVTVAEEAGTADFDLTSVEPDQYDIVFSVLDPAQILVSLEDVDYGVVNGNYIADSDRLIIDALKIENTPLEHRIIVSVNEEDGGTQWAKDLKAAYESPEFEEFILSQQEYEGFILPEAWDNN